MINIKKQYQQTAGLTQRLINISHLLLIGVIVAEKFCSRKCVVVFCKFVVHGEQITCQTDKGNRQKHAQFSQCVPVLRMPSILSALGSRLDTFINILHLESVVGVH